MRFSLRSGICETKDPESEDGTADDGALAVRFAMYHL